MSGFVSVLHTDNSFVDPSVIDSLLQSIKHRGSDQQTKWIDKELALGHSLFKTTSESEFENQPATLDKKIWIVCNARIDGRKELVSKLGLTKSLSLDVTPDSELILHAYKKWGEDCVKHLLGDFAFVIWDKEQQKIFAARDHFGVCQLYFSYKNNILIISNTLKCMLSHPNVSRHLNDKAIGSFLLFGDHLFLDKSITAFKDVMSLEPAHSLSMKRGKLSIAKYWDIPSDTPMLHYRKERDYLDHFQEIFQIAVMDRMRTSSITISMSGGLDSTSIAATAKYLQKKSISYSKINAITSTFDEIPLARERYYAELAAKKLNIPIHYISADKYHLLDPYIATTRPTEMLLPELAFDFDQISLKYSRVQLIGASADNLFDFSPVKTMLSEGNLGRIFFDVLRMRKLYRRTPPLGTGLISMLKHRTSKRRRTSFMHYSEYPVWLDSEFEKNMNLKEHWENFLYSQPPYSHPRHPNAYTSLTTPNWAIDDIFFDNKGFDSPDIRDPFLDLRLVKFAFSLPPLPWFFNKHIMRRAMYDILPPEITQRPKTPLGDLQAALLKNPINQWVDTWNATPELTHFVQRNKVPSILNETNGVLSYINARPLLLNTWLKNI